MTGFLIKTKQDLNRALNGQAFQFVESLEVVNERDLKATTDKAKSHLRKSKKLQLVILERR